MTATSPVVAGLCSITFRQLEARAVAQLAVDCGLRAIEWGGDVHVPSGQMSTAHEVRRMCDDLGLEIWSYGSYIAAGRDGADAAEVAFDTAVELGAPNVRVWALGPDAGPALDAMCAAAAQRDLTVSLEFHPGTRTETAASALALLAEVGRDRLYTYWQPDPGLDVEAALAGLEEVLPNVSHLHVFSWQPDATRRPLADGADLWRSALAMAANSRRAAFLEFVRDDDPEQLRADAATLRSWVDAQAAGQ